eukprot:4955748-Prymnesium_polylepis.1
MRSASACATASRSALSDVIRFNAALPSSSLSEAACSAADRSAACLSNSKRSVSCASAADLLATSCD